MVLVWDVQTGKEIIALKGHKMPIRALAFSPDGTLLATGSNDTTIKLWAWGPADADPPRGKLLATLEGHKSPVQAVAFSPDGKTLASGGTWKEGGVKLWNVAGRKERATLDSGLMIFSRFDKPGPRPVSAVVFSPNGKQVAAVCHNVAKVWDAATGREQATVGPDGLIASLLGSDGLLGLPGSSGQHGASAAFTRDGKSLVTTWGHQSRNPLPNSGGPLGPGLGGNLPSDCSPLKTWDLATRRARVPLQFRQVEVTHIDESTKRVHRTGHGSEVIAAFAYAADGKLMVTGGSQFPLTGKETKFYNDISKLITVVEKNPEDYAHVVKLWETSKGRPVAVLKGHRGALFAVAFAPDGAWVASGGRESVAGINKETGVPLGTIRIWNVGRATADKGGK